MTWSTLRLEGRALEQCMVLELQGFSTCHVRGIRMKTADGDWVVVSASTDERVSGILQRMRRIAFELAVGLLQNGFKMTRADQVVEMGNGDLRSIDLVLVKQHTVFYCELKWSSLQVNARRNGTETLRAWLREAAGGCTLIAPSGRRTAGANASAAILLASPQAWSLEIDSGRSGCSNRFPYYVKQAYVAQRGRPGTSGSAKRSRSSVAYTTEATRRRNEGREDHNAWAAASMAKMRAQEGG